MVGKVRVNFGTCHSGRHLSAFTPCKVARLFRRVVYACMNGHFEGSLHVGEVKEWKLERGEDIS